jgi:hypothetical protein
VRDHAWVSFPDRGFSVCGSCSVRNTAIGAALPCPGVNITPGTSKEKLSGLDPSVYMLVEARPRPRTSQDE